MIYGYAKASKNTANRELAEQKQMELLRDFGAEKIIVETDGSQLGELLVNLKPNDVLHVVSIDRLTRSVHRMGELADYFKKNNIALYEAGRPVDLNMHLLMFQITQLPTPEYEEDEYEDEPNKDMPNDDVVDLCFRILECETSHAARKIIDAFPEERLKHLALFLYHQYYNLKKELEL